MVWQRLDNPDGRPLNEAVYEYIRSEICRGAMRGRLPSKNRAAEALGVSKVTIEKAYEQLKAEGYIYARERSGYFVELDSAMAWRAERLAEQTERTDHVGGRTDRTDQVNDPSDPSAIHDKDDPSEGLSPFVYDLNTYAVSADSFPFAVWSRLMRRVMSEEGPAIVGNTPPKGIIALREAIVSYLLTYRGISAAPEQVIVGAGSEWIWSLFIQLLGTQRRYAIENPGYGKVSSILGAYGVVVSRVGMGDDGIDLEALRGTQADVVHITPSHHFPLGIIMPIQKRLELLALAAEKDMVIIEDDYDSEFRFAGRPIPALTGLDSHGRVIYVNTFAKSLAPSLRISYMVLPPALLAHYERKLSFYACTVPGFEQHVMARFLSEGHFARHFTRMKATYKAKHDALLEGIAASRLAPDVAITGKSVGLHILLTLKGGLSESDMVRRAAQQGVALRGLSAFCTAPCAIPASTVVMGFASLDMAGIPDLLRRLERAWLGNREKRAGSAADGGRGAD
ncbi:MAG: PLP-dependent aminotransferase family protein [Lentisphaeria bacterium]|nr:PLP-dependent aminotransferase family protein [Lentisphaeria bacterium]